MRKLCDKTWFIQKYKQQEFWSNNTLISSQFTEYVQHQVFYQMQQQIHKFLYFKLKTEVIIDQKSFLVIELSKFGFMYMFMLNLELGLLHFHWLNAYSSR